MHLLHQIEHALERDHYGFIQVLVKAECDPPRVGPGTGPREMEVWMQLKLDLDTLDRAFQRGPGHFAIALNRMAIADREEPTVHGDRQIQRASRNQLLTVDVPSTEP